MATASAPDPNIPEAPDKPEKPVKATSNIVVRDIHGKEFVVAAYPKSAFTDAELLAFVHPAESQFQRDLKAASDRAQAPARAKAAREAAERARLAAPPKPSKPISTT